MLRPWCTLRLSCPSWGWSFLARRTQHLQRRSERQQQTWTERQLASWVLAEPWADAGLRPPLPHIPVNSGILLLAKVTHFFFPRNFSVLGFPFCFSVSHCELAHLALQTCLKTSYWMLSPERIPVCCHVLSHGSCDSSLTPGCLLGRRAWPRTERKQRPARHPHLQAESLLRTNHPSASRVGREASGRGRLTSRLIFPAKFEGRSRLSLTFEGKGGDVIDELSLLEGQGMRSLPGLSLGEEWDHAAFPHISGRGVRREGALDWDVSYLRGRGGWQALSAFIQKSGPLSGKVPEGPDLPGKQRAWRVCSSAQDPKISMMVFS